MTKTMILSVGGSEAPLAHTINHFKPELVVFVCSADTNCTIAKIHKLLVPDYNPRTKTIELSNHQDFGGSYIELMNQLPKIIPPEYEQDVLVDFTGGTKVMSATLAMFGVEKGYKFSYVGGKERTKAGVGIVVDGTEEVFTCENPWNKLAVKEMDEICHLFNISRYKEMAEKCRFILEKRIDRQVDIALSSQLECLEIYGKAFDSWDNFRYRECELNKAQKLCRPLVALGGIFGQLFECGGKLEPVLATIKSGEPKDKHKMIILDLIANGDRRALVENKHDDAFVRLYSAIERVARFKLLDEYQIDNSRVKESQVPVAFKERVIKYAMKNNDGTSKLALQNSFELLKELGDPIGHRCMEIWQTTIAPIQYNRNQSYLGHGEEQLKPDAYEKLRKVIFSEMGLNEKELPIFPKLIK